jgi:hypothetical protein
MLGVRLLLNRWALIAVVGIASVVASCSSAPVNGTVVGEAPICEGPYIPPHQVAAMKVKVTLLQDARVIGVQVVQGQHRYRFSVPSGNYVVKSDQGGTTPAKVTVKSGQTTVADLPSICR